MKCNWTVRELRRQIKTNLYVRVGISRHPENLLQTTTDNQNPYALSGMDNQLFVSTYMLHLPDKKVLENFMRKELHDMGL